MTMEIKNSRDSAAAEDSRYERLLELFADMMTRRAVVTTTPVCPVIEGYKCPLSPDQEVVCGRQRRSSGRRDEAIRCWKQWVQERLNSKANDSTQQHREDCG